jgi:hypothetical protein
MEWIKSEERLPTKIGIYYVCYEENELRIKICDFEYWCGKEWIQKINGFYECPKWWFEIPEPPTD